MKNMQILTASNLWQQVYAHIARVAYTPNSWECIRNQVFCIVGGGGGGGGGVGGAGGWRVGGSLRKPEK